MPRKTKTVNQLSEHGSELALLRKLRTDVEKREAEERKATRNLLGMGAGPRSYKDDAISVSAVPDERLAVRTRKLKQDLTKAEIFGLWEKGVLVPDPYKLRKRLGKDAAPYLKTMLTGYRVFAGIRDRAAFEGREYAVVRKDELRSIYEKLQAYAQEHPKDREARAYLAFIDRLLKKK